VNEHIYYEQPLNERIRVFLRLEKLFHQFAFHIKHDSCWNHPVAVNAIIELLNFTTRSDIKLEALKELERQYTRLDRLSMRPQIDHQQLSSLLLNLDQRIKDLKANHGQIGQELQQVELLSSIRQKSSVPGVICYFDLPAYSFWLTQPDNVRRQHLEHWYSPFSILDRSVQLILDVIRHSAEHTDESAEHGFFQKTMDTSQAVQLLRIALPNDSVCYPEISAGKHRFSVRFMKNKNPASRPEQCSENISFKLGICSI
jgi:cell division protein ZapD